MALSVGRTRFILIIAVAGILALTLIGAVLNGSRNAVAYTGPEKPAYLRINISKQGSVYLEFQGSEFRAATSVEGLKSAQPVLMRWVSGDLRKLPEITFPIPSDQLPAGVTAVKATFAPFSQARSVGDFSSFVVNMYIRICRQDENKSQWQCDVFRGYQAGSVPERAPVVELPNLEKLSLAVAAQPSKGTLGISVRLLAGNNQLSDMRKDDRPVEAQVRVLDASGKEVASKRGPLADFGFS